MKTKHKNTHVNKFSEMSQPINNSF